MKFENKGRWVWSGPSFLLLLFFDPIKLCPPPPQEPLRWASGTRTRSPAPMAPEEEEEEDATAPSPVLLPVRWEGTRCSGADAGGHSP